MTDAEKAAWERGWQAGLLAAQHWHEAQAQQAMVQSRRSRFPKNYEREAELHRNCAERMQTLIPDET